MKKSSFYNSVNTSLLVILITYIIQVAFLLLQFNSDNPLDRIINDSKNILFSFLIFYVIIYIVIMILQPMKIKKSIKKITHIFDEYRKGNYNYDLDPTKESIEKEFSPLIESTEKMMSNILQFDKLKETKIFSHYSKLKALLSIISDGAIIIDKSGEILYVNDVMLGKFRNLDLGVNKDLLDIKYPDFFEKTVKVYIKEVLVQGKKSDSKHFFIPELNLEFTIISALYKNRSGDYLGAVFIISDFQEKFEQELKEQQVEDEHYSNQDKLKED